MNCEQAKGLFSERLDGTLQGTQADRLEQHLTGCEGCRQGLASLDEALAALHGLEPASTSSALRDSILGALDQALEETTEGSKPTAFALLGFTHAASLLLGAAAAVACILWIPAVSEALAPIRLVEVAVASEPEVIERIVELRVPYEVPYEVPVEVRVEVPVEVPVEVFVDRVVTVDRWLPVKEVVLFDGHAFAQVLAGLSSSLRFSAGVLEAQRFQSEPLCPEDIMAAAPTPQSAARELSEGLPEYSASASVVLNSAPGRLTMETSGPLRSVVPLLLEQLDSGEGEVVAMVGRRLSSIRSAALADPSIAGQLVEPVSPVHERSVAERFFGAREQAEAQTPHEQWSAWWEANGELVASAGPSLRL